MAKNPLNGVHGEQATRLAPKNTTDLGEGGWGPDQSEKVLPLWVTAVRGIKKREDDAVIN